MCRRTQAHLSRTQIVLNCSGKIAHLNRAVPACVDLNLLGTDGASLSPSEVKCWARRRRIERFASVSDRDLVNVVDVGTQFSMPVCVRIPATFAMGCFSVERTGEAFTRMSLPEGLVRSVDGGVV